MTANQSKAREEESENIIMSDRERGSQGEGGRVRLSDGAKGGGRAFLIEQTQKLHTGSWDAIMVLKVSSNVPNSNALFGTGQFICVYSYMLLTCIVQDTAHQSYSHE